MKRKLIATVLSLAMAFSFTVVSAMAANGPTVTVETAEAQAKTGDEVSLNVSIAGNSGFTNYEWNIQYDKNRLELKKIDGNVLSTQNVSHSRTEWGYANFAAATANVSDGELFTLTFAVKSDAPSGLAEVKITSDNFKNNGQEINATYVAGGVTVADSTTGGSTTGGSTTGGSTTGGSTTGGSTTGGSTTGGSTTGGSTTGGSTTGGSTTGGSTTGGSTTGGSTTGGSTTGGSTTGGSTTGGSTTGGSTTGGGETDAVQVTNIGIGDECFTVTGQTVTVTYLLPCKVGYISNGEYIAIEATDNGDGSYSYTAPDGVTELKLVVKGDANGDGKVTVADILLILAYTLETGDMDAVSQFAANVDGNNSITVADILTILAHTVDEKPLTW